MSDLLKEAIADAKAVRATALANAKAALEESFKPTLEAMLAEKLKSEIGDDVPAQSSRISNPSPAAPNHDVDDEGRSRPLTINRYSDSGQGLQEESDEEVTSEELDEILAELEREMGDAPTAPTAPTAPAAEVPPMAPSMDASMAPVEPAAEMPTPVPSEEEVDEEINLQELLDTLSEEVEEVDEANEEDSMEEAEESEPTKESVQLAEALHTVQYLRDQLNEINLLNAKLLYTNKLFNKFTLNQAQKMKVVETFDLTHSIREVKLSYKILSESLSSGGSAVKKPNTAAHTITEGLASKPVASTAPKKQLIVENSNVMASRFQRLAGIKK
jgi:hypothetical protein